ncbi:MAG: hypothetical protein ACRDRO_27920 [Pseudonocardiaceae bacterium]
MPYEQLAKIVGFHPATPDTVSAIADPPGTASRAAIIAIGRLMGSEQAASVMGWLEAGQLSR